MLKRFGKKILLSQPVAKRLSPFYIRRAETRNHAVENEFVRRFISRENFWIFSQTKSGTTLLCNALAAYAAECRGDRFSFSELSKFGVFRVQNAEKDLEEYVKLRCGRNGVPIFVHTHWAISALFRHAFIVTRSPYDQMISNYYFKYVNRTGRGGKIDKHIPRLVADYAKVFNQQRGVIEHDPDNVSVITYETLVSNPEVVLALVLEKAGVTVSNALLESALAQVSPERVKEHEVVSGKAIVAGGNFSEKHFVRSGKIGEYKEFFKDEQLRVVSRELERYGVPDDGIPHNGRERILR